jgi:hypothetical protein
MKKVLVDNIMNLEDYLLTADARHKASYLHALTITNLFAIHDKLVESLRNTDED